MTFEITALLICVRSLFLLKGAMSKITSHDIFSPPAPSLIVTQVASSGELK